MRKQFSLATLLLITLQFAFAQNPVIGTYPATTVSFAGGNTTVTPAIAPSNSVGMSASATPLFKGSFRVNPTTGLLSITNAYPAGTYTVKVKAWNTNSLTIDSFPLTVGSNGCSQGSMLTSQNTAPASRPYNVAVADFNGDGHQDLVTVNYATSGNASVRMGNGAGGFSGTSEISMIYDASEIATADFNGDGKQDIIAGGSYNTSVAVRLGNGNGTFGPVTNVTTGSFTRSIVTADFNGDGRADFAAAVAESPVTVVVRLSDGAGGFINAPDCSVTGTPQKLATGDFNNDGITDLAVQVNNSGFNSIYIRFGDGNGNFYGIANAGYLSLGVQSFSVGDMNNDGNLDIVGATFSSSGYVYVYLGNGAGNFTYATDKYVGNSPIGSAIADFNGDSKMDVVVANYNGSNWATFLGNGAGGLGNAALTGGLGYVIPTAPVAGDFNEDGLMDLAIPDFNGSKVMIVLNRVAEINIRGNNTDIVDGSTTPTTANATDFGDVSNRLSRTYTIQNTGIGFLTVQGITTSGADSTQFVIGGATFPLRIATGTSATFTVTFVPISAGLKTTTLKIANDDCDEAIYDFALQGNAVAAVPVLGTYAAAPVPAGG